MTVVSSLVIEMAANVARLQQDMDRARKVVDDSMGRITGAVEGAQRAFGLLAAAAGGASFGVAIKNAINLADQMDDLAEKTGITAKALSGLRFAGEATGTPMEALSTGLRKLSQNMASASAGSKEQAEVFARLGVKVNTAMGSLRGSDEVLRDLADRFSDMQDGPAKAALAMDLFGKSGVDMVPLLNQGADGIEALHDEAVKLGAVVSNDFAKQAADFNDSLTKMRMASEGFMSSMAKELLPTLNRLAEAFLGAQRSGSPLSEFLGKVLKTAIETVSILGANLVFVFQGIWRELKGIYDQAAAILSLDFEKFKNIKIKLDLDNTQAAQDLKNFEGTVFGFSGRGVGYTDARLEEIKQKQREIADKEAEEERKRILRAQLLKEQQEAAAKAQLKLIQDGVKLSESLTAVEGGLSADFADKWSGLSAAFASGRINLERLTQSQAALLALQPAMKKALEDRAKLEKELADQQKKTLDDAWKAVDAIDAQIKSENNRIATFGLGKSALAELTLAEYEQQMAALQATENVIPGYIDSLQIRIDKQKELIAAMKKGEVQEASADAAKRAAEDWKRASEQINQSLTDALLRGFEAGKGFAQNLRDTLKNMFNTLVLRPVIQAVVGGVSGLGGASASAGGGSDPVGSFNALKNLYTQGSATLSVGSQWLAGTMSSANAAGTLGANMTGTGIDGLLASNGAFGTAGSSASTLGAAGTMLGGALVGFMAGKMISGGYSAVGKSGNTAVVSGTAIGAIVGGPIGAAIGGAIGGVVNRAFGMGAKTVTGEGITGTFGADGASVQGYSDWSQKGGWFRSNKSGRDYSAVSSDLDSFLDSSLASVTATAKGYAQVLGLSTGAIDGYTKKIDIKLKGLDAAGREKAISDAIAGFGDGMAEQLLGTFETVTTKTGSFFKRTTQTTSQWIAGPYVRAGETAGQALTRLGTSLQGVNAVLGTLNQNLLATSLAGGDAASKLADLFGGLQGMQQATSAYYQTYYTEAERNAKTTEQLTTALAGMGAKLPDTLSGWRALVDAQDLSTEAGRRNYASLINLAPAFAQVTGAADSLAAKLGQVVSKLVTSALTDIDKQITASTAAADAARAAANAYRDASTSLTAAVASIMGAVGDARQNAEQAYGAALASARGGDVTAMQALPQLATAMLAQQRNGAGNSLQAALQAAKAASELSGVSSVANALGVQKDYQSKLYDVNTAALEVLRSTLASGNATVDEIKALSTTLTNVGQMLIDSDKLTVGAVTTSSGVIKATLVDTSGRVVGTLDSNSAQNLNGLNGQTSILSKLSADQILKLQDSTGVQTNALAVQEIATRATAGSSATLTDVLAQLKLPDPSLTLITSQIANGNFAIVNGLTGVVGAINNQTLAQQAEIKRQQDLTKAQKDIEALVNTYKPQIDSLSGSIASKQAEKAGYDQSIAAVAPNYNAWSYGTRWNFDWVWKPGSERLGKEIADAQNSLNSMTGTYNSQLEAARQQIRALGGVPAFAMGGLHSGGLRLVGENGPELEVTGPSRIYNAQQTQEILRGTNVPTAVQNQGGQQGDPALRQLVAELTQRVQELHAAAQASAIANQQHLQLVNRLTRGGQSMPVTGVQNDPLQVEVAA